MITTGLLKFIIFNYILDSNVNIVIYSPLKISRGDIDVGTLTSSGDMATTQARGIPCEKVS